MGLLSIFKRRADSTTGAAGAVSEPADAVQRARIRARQRLIGAAVLVGIGVIGFPLVFETQPRPIPVDIPIEVPRKDGAPPLVMPTMRPPPAPRPRATR
jgi:DedD protein